MCVLESRSIGIGLGLAFGTAKVSLIRVRGVEVTGGVGFFARCPRYGTQRALVSVIAKVWLTGVRAQVRTD